MDLTDLIAKIPASFGENPESIAFTNGDHVVLRQTVPSIIARALAAENQAVLRMGTLADQYWTVDQLERREEIELWRILAYAISWSYKDEHKKPVPLVRASFDFLVPGEHVSELIAHLNQRKVVQSPEDAKSLRPERERLGEGHGDANGLAPAVTAEVLASQGVA